MQLPGSLCLMPEVGTGFMFDWETFLVGLVVGILVCVNLMVLWETLAR